jgi:DNA-binding GntR family transcriptional regulator
MASTTLLTALNGEAPLPRPASGPERVADAITKGLMRRVYRVGQRLVEAELTERFQVSRGTVREALKSLAASGVVELVPHRGAVIRGLSLADARNLLAVLEVLTGLAARLAAQRIEIGRNKAQFAAAAKPLVAPRSADEMVKLLDRRARFYQAIFDIAGSDDLDRAMPTWRAHLFRSQVHAHLTKSDLRAMMDEYRQIVEAILEGDGERAEAVTRKHLQKSGERSLPHLR